MEIKHGLHLSQRPSLIMTQRLQQALKLLQLPQLELNLVIKQELQTNPVLEEVDDLTEEPAVAEERPMEGDGLPTTEPEKETAEAREDEDWSEYYQSNDLDNPYIPAEDHSAEYFEKVAVTTMGLAENVESQLRLLPLGEEEMAVGAYMVGLLDDRGYLVNPRTDGGGSPETVLGDIAEVLGKPVAMVEKVLKVIQSLEPTGVGARDLRECLLLQLRQRGHHETLAYRVIEEQFDQLVNRKFNDIARHFKVSLEQVQEAGDLIGTLSPKPGHDISQEEPKYIIPDLVVERVEGEYVVYLNDRHVPRLRINQTYEKLLRERKGRGDKTREYVQGKLSSAKWLIQTIEQRRRTMIKVMTCIVAKQREFFEKGIQQLRPLTLQDVAQEIGMHESTVSRVTSGKYVQTQRGVFELKFFFSSGLKQESGEDISAKTARNMIQHLVEAEDKRDPLSDQRIAEFMKDKGVDIARRTVAKYREQLQILPARYRKRI